jgi:co-chaperonin GroES (HSP10)
MSEPTIITVLHDLIVIRPIREATTLDWGFQLPASEESQQTPYMGEVIATGPGRRTKLSRPAEALVRAARDVCIRLEGALAVETLCAALRDLEGTVDRHPMTVQPGDRVVYSRNGWQAFRLDGEDVVVCQEASIMGILPPA